MKYEQCPYYEEKCDTNQCFCIKYQAYQDVQDINVINNELKELGIDINLSDWDKIMAMQSKFASRFSNTNNPSKEITDAWNKEYLICIEDEINELMDYINLPSRKCRLTDLKGLKKEVIDILHFVMDTFITGGITSQEIQNRYLKKYHIKEVTNFFKYAFYLSQLELASKYRQLTKPINNEIVDLHTALTYKWEIDSTDVDIILIDLIINLLEMNRKIRECISWKHWKKPNKEINYNKLYDVYVELFIRFLALCAFVFDNPDEIINTYIVKNVENIRRQKLGY